MEIVQHLIHLENFLPGIVHQFGTYIYAILFFVIFAETGFVVTPFLPGDSLIFAVGALAGSGYLNVWVVYILMLIAAIAGNTLNYYLGKRIGARAFENKNAKFLNPHNLERTHEFFAKYGGKTIIMTRFVPIIRSFAPFVAGMGAMEYNTFQKYNIIGGILWVTIFLFAGYFFGAMPFVKKNFELIALGIVVVSVLPPLIEYFKHKKKKSHK